MEVLNSNFSSLFSEIEKAINASLFVSIDCELSGLNIVRNIKAFDTPQEYYSKMRINSKDFLVLQYGISTFRSKIENFLTSDETELQLPKCNAFFRKLIYQTKEEKYSNQIYLETRQVDKDRVLFVTRLKSPEEEKQLAKKRYEENLKELDNFHGFSKLLKVLIKSGKLIIGHNLCLDFLHTIDKFLMPLPESYTEFKRVSHTLFSRVLDTKYMASSGLFKDLIQSTVLKHLLDTVSERPFGLPQIAPEKEGRAYEVNDSKEHEAGYDAFITGLSFIGMWKHLGLLDNRSDPKTFNSMDLLEPYINKLFLMNLSDNQYINLAGDDQLVSRDHVFHISFSEDWKLSNIQQLFSPFGNVYVSWLDETSAYVALHKRDEAKMCYTTLKSGDGYIIKTFAERKMLLENRFGHMQPKVVSSPIPSKKRKSSDSPVPKNQKREKTGIDDALLKMTIEPELEAQSKKSRTFTEDENWT
ncbi:poly(A)-specific ribonuclease PARN isoform X3 [Diabrotica virgifera virgifera]|uniref:Poly(A)-specific ribonuclease RNA-binding domain-containing protein n=1 Tax=Diabrotica virgifera virgifera TaxID=50390 RepID=A0ABM5JW12_DIAVI|nr:poly(A)-specific ribonuclease PARN isoform X3 [Diabrotica virgifera virgifera]